MDVLATIFACGEAGADEALAVFPVVLGAEVTEPGVFPCPPVVPVVPNKPPSCGRKRSSCSNDLPRPSLPRPSVL